MTSMRYTFNGILTFADYTYDNIGNIKSSKYTYYDKVYSEVAYVYDDHNRLIAENCTNSNIGITPYMSSYSYDSFGNITETERPNSAGVTVKNTYSYENSSWRDLLTAYNGHTITYDKIGNPLSYYNGRSYTMNWEMGRQLLSSRVNSRTVYYDYNKDGIRIKKNVSGRYTDRYILDGSKVIGMERTKSGSSVKDVYHFIYDEMGNIWEAVCYIGGSTTPVRYFYRTNAQGDVKQIVDSNYNVVAYYAYDAWGKLLAVLDGNDNPITDSSHFAIVNPFRYRGYVYDTETGFYYVSSRFYDPEIGRWINADNQIAGVGGEVLGYNIFAYCMNNPVNMSDPSGSWPKWATKLVAAVAVVAVVAVVAAVTVATAGAGTAIAAVAVGAAKGAAIGFAVGAATGAACGAISHRISTGSWDGAGEAALNGMANGALSGAVNGAITGGITGGLSYNSGATSAGKGFDTYRQLKNEIGSPGAGNEWHHIVEQSQISKSGFSPQMIQNTNNIMSISKTTHRAISGYYSSVQPFTNEMIVRNWLAGQSFNAQYEFGINVIKMFM